MWSYSSDTKLVGKLRSGNWVHHCKTKNWECGYKSRCFPKGTLKQSSRDGMVGMSFQHDGDVIGDVILSSIHLPVTHLLGERRYYYYYYSTIVCAKVKFSEQRSRELERAASK